MNIKTILIFVLIATFLGSPAFAQFNQTPIALWDFEDNSSAGTFLDITPNTHNGLFIADAIFSTDSKETNQTGNNSAEFDGTGDRADITTDLQDFVFGDGADDTAFSVGGWAFMNDATGFRIISKRAGNTQIEWGLFSTAGDVFNFGVMDDDNAIRQARLTGSVTALEGKWIFVVGTYDGSESSGGINIYIDGVISDIANDNAGAYTAMDDSGSNVTLAAINTVSVSNGFLDEVFVIGIELSSEQVNIIMNEGWGFDRLFPVITNISVNDTVLFCNDVIRLSANVTDDTNISNVTFGFNDLDGNNIVLANRSGLSDLYIFEKQYTVSSSLQTYNFTNVTATDIVGRTTTNFTTSVNYNYSCTAADITPPVILTPNFINGSVLDQRVTNQTINFTVTDNIGIRNASIFLFNDSPQAQIDFLINGSPTSFNILDEIDVSQFAAGSYFIRWLTYDTSNNSAEQLGLISIVNFDTFLNLISPINNTLISFVESVPGSIGFVHEVGTQAMCSLRINGTIVVTENVSAGTQTQTFNIDSVTNRVNSTLRWEFTCNVDTVGDINSSFHILEIHYLGSTTDAFDLNSCPNTSTTSVLFYFLLLILAFGIMIFDAVVIRAGIYGWLGSILLIVLSFPLFACIGIYAITVLLTGVLLFIYFLGRGFTVGF